jgi:ribosomal protein S18 acetylase RimI-like enzyme
MDAITMYQKDGYQIIDIWKGYYNDGEDAQLMEKSLR